MTDTIKRWECPECGRDFDSPSKIHNRGASAPVAAQRERCPGILVECVYVAVDERIECRKALGVIQNIQHGNVYSPDDPTLAEVADDLRAAIAIVTGISHD